MDSKPAAVRRRKNSKKSEEVNEPNVKIASSKNRKPPSTVQIALIGIIGFFLVVVTNWPALAIQFLPDSIRTSIEPLFQKYVSTKKSGDALHQPTAAKPYTPVFTEDTTRKDAVVAALKHAWRGYERDAWGYDDYNPLTRAGSNLAGAAKGIGYTIVDSLDTLIIMAQNEHDYDGELKAMVKRADSWIENELNFDEGGDFNTFEITIRILGGLLSAQHLTHKDATQDSIYLSKAVDLADRLLTTFDTPTGLPLSNIHLRDRLPRGDPDNNGWCSISEVTTLQLEFKYLAHLTGEERYWRKVERAMQAVRDAFPPRAPRLPSIFIHPESGRFIPFAIRLGSRGDSYYEYLLKQYLQTNRTEDIYREMYDEAMDAVSTHLMRRSPTQKLLYTIELYPQQSQEGTLTMTTLTKQDHLVCFLGGSLLLGVTEGQAPVPPTKQTFERDMKRNNRDWGAGKAIIETCMETHDTATGLAAEITMFEEEGAPAPAGLKKPGKDWYIKGSDRIDDPILDARYILRPETVESLFIAFRLTGDPQYREWGWQIFQAIEKHCKLPEMGYTSVRNVDRVEGDKGREDRMETFFVSETLKYLYLLFTDASVIPLKDYVFNTEAHPLPVFQPQFSTNLI